MKNLRKVAIFLFLIGLDKSRKIMNLMDSGELKQVLKEMKDLNEVSSKEQALVKKAFSELGYETSLSPGDTMFLIRQIFNDNC